MRRVVWAASCWMLSVVSLGAQMPAPRPSVVLQQADRLIVEVLVDENGFVDQAFLNPALRPNLQVLGDAGSTDLVVKNVSQDRSYSVHIGTLKFGLEPRTQHRVSLLDVMAALNGQADKKLELKRLDSLPVQHPVASFALGALSQPRPLSRPQDVVRDSQTKRIAVTVPIREDGIRDATFLNSKNPALVAEAGEASLVDFQFQNLSATSDFTIRLGSKTLLLSQRSQSSLAVQDLLPELVPVNGLLRGEFSVVDGNGTPIPDGLGYFVVGTSAMVGESNEPAEQEAQTVPTPLQSVVQAISQTPLFVASTAASQDPTAIRSPRKGAEAAQLAAPAQPTAPATPQSASATSPPLPPAQERLVRIPLNGVGVDDWGFRNLRNPPYLLRGSPGENVSAARDTFRNYVAARAEALTDPSVKAAMVEGIGGIDSHFKEAQGRYQQAVAIGDARARAAATPPEDPWARLALLYMTDIEFVNDAIDRTFTITFDIPTPARIANATAATLASERADFEKRSGLRVGDCKETCRVLLNLPYKSPQRFGVRWLAGESNAPDLLDFVTWYAHINKPQPAVAFTVSLFDENAAPAENTAYVSLVPLSSLREATSKTAWILSPTISANREPFVADTATLATDEGRQFPGDVRRVLNGVARLRLVQTLGSRADAFVEFGFKGGPLGEKGYNGTVTTPTYQVNVNSVPGTRLSFGRFVFAQPANAIAIREFGEGFRLSLRNKAALSYVVKRESATGTPDTGNRDDKVLLFELNNIVGRRWPSVRGLNFIGLFGQDRAPESKHQYWTAGFDFQFSVPDSSFSGTAAYYHSDRKALGTETTPPILRGKGNVGLATFGYTWFRRPTSPAQATQKVASSVRGEWARGSGDRRSTTDQDESYLGETSAFAPENNLFLALFSGKFVVGADNTSLRLAGLRNKQYFAVVYQEERFTPLEAIAKLIQVPEADIASRLFRAGVRSYHFSGDIYDGNERHDGGREFFLDSTIETPAGVRAGLNVTYYKPGSAVRDFFTDSSIWSVIARLTVSLGS